MEFNESESRTCRFLRQSAGKVSDVTYSLSAASSKVNLRTFYSFCLLSSFVVKQVKQQVEVGLGSVMQTFG